MFNNKKINMLLSLIVAIALWAYVMGEVNPSQTQLVKGIPVQFENQKVLNERGLAVAVTGTTTIDLTVEGSRKVIADIGPDSFTATADVSECIEGDNILEVDVDTSKEVSRVTDSTITIHVNVEKIVSEKKTIKAEYTGEEPIDTELEFDIVSDESVTVTGAESLVEAVEYVRADISDMNLINNGQTIEAKLVPVNNKGIEIHNITLSAENAEVTISELATKKVKLNVDVTGKPAAGYLIDGINVPDSVIIKGRQSDLDRISGVTANTIDVSGLNSTTKIELEIPLPEGVSISSQSLPVIATINISKVTGEDEESEISISENEIELTGIDEGLNAEVISGDIQLKVKNGGEVSKRDFSLSADLSGLEPGTHEVPLKVEYAGEGTVSGAPDEIKVKISEE